MAKKKETEATTWAGKMKEFGGGNFTFLSSDGETLIFIVVGLPVLLKSTFKGKENDRIGCPVVTDEGFQLFITGKRCARKLSKFEGSFEKSAMMITRHGGEGDVNAKYDVKLCPDVETFKHLQELKANDFDEDMIVEAIEEANKTLQN